VGRALVLENAAFQHAPDAQPFWSTFTRDAFYVRTGAWKQSVVQRGLAVLAQAEAHSAAAPEGLAGW